MNGEAEKNDLMRAMGGDADAFLRAVTPYFPMLYAYARSITGDRPGDTFRGWLWTITHYKLGDYFRAQGKGPSAAGGSTAQLQLHDLTAEAPIEPAADDDSQSEILHRALALIRLEFEANTWQAFWQTAVDGRPADLVAAELGMTCQAVRQAKYRVLRRLRNEMRDEGVS